MTSEAIPEGEHLYVVYLGGDMKQGRIGEDHEVVFVVARDVRSARQAARAKWTGDDERPHIDSVALLQQVDGYRIELVADAGSGDLSIIDPSYEAAPEPA